MNRGPVLKIATAILVSFVLLAVGGWLALRAIFPGPAAQPAAAAASAADSAPEPVAEAPDVTPGLRGRILDAEGNPVSGASVRVVTPSAPYRVLHEATSDVGGAFSFTQTTPGSVLVVADRDPAGFVTSGVLEITADKATEITLVLSATSGVRGTAVDTAGHPVEGATISVAGMPWTVPSATTNSAGTFHLIVVPNEATALVAEASGYDTVRFALVNRQPGVELLVPLRLSGAVAAKDASSEGEPGSIEGVVVDGNGAGVPSFTLRAQINDAPQGARREVGALRKFEDPHGAFLVDRLVPGRYVLTVYAAGQPSKRSEPVDVQAGTATRGVKIVLSQGGTVIGLVYDKHRVPVAGADVFFDVPSAEASDAGAGTIPAGGVSTKTDQQGHYRIDNAPAGALRLRVQKAGFRTRVVGGLQVRAGGTLTRDVVVVPGG